MGLSFSSWWINRDIQNESGIDHPKRTKPSFDMETVSVPARQYVESADGSENSSVEDNIVCNDYVKSAYGSEYSSVEHNIVCNDYVKSAYGSEYSSVEHNIVCNDSLTSDIADRSRRIIYLTDCEMKKSQQSISIFESWQTCLEKNSKSIAGILIERGVFPSADELNLVGCRFGKKSQILLDVCDMISKQIKTSSGDVMGVWPSYRADNGNIIFIVILKNNSTFCVFKEYEIHRKYVNNVNSEEGELVATHETKDETINPSNDEILEQLRQCINKNADNLLKNHNNLNVILPSLKKSVGYKSGKHYIKDEPCISLYVTVKGLIPLKEKHIDKKIDGFQTDVLEGEFESYEGGPNNYHEHLKIGLAIHTNSLNGHVGTLGGFIEHPLHGLCGITCAHVLFSNDELRKIQQKEPIYINKTVFQPWGDLSSAFGEVVHVVCDEGNDTLPGMDVALFIIKERKPKDGSFPKVFNDIEAGFDNSHPLCFNSGDVCEKSKIKRRTEVYKLGMSTGLTRGSFELQGAVIRRTQMQGVRQDFGFNLKDQMVILQIGHNPFAECGDSGALVLMENGEDSAAIGIVEGGMRGRVFVTPIGDILRAFGCTDIKMLQFSPECQTVATDSGVEMDVSGCI